MLQIWKMGCDLPAANRRTPLTIKNRGGSRSRISRTDPDPLILWTRHPCVPLGWEHVGTCGPQPIPSRSKSVLWWCPYKRGDLSVRRLTFNELLSALNELDWGRKIQNDSSWGHVAAFPPRCGWLFPSFSTTLEDVISLMMLSTYTEFSMSLNIALI